MDRLLDLAGFCDAGAWWRRVALPIYPRDEVGCLRTSAALRVYGTTAVSLDSGRNAFLLASLTVLTALLFRNEPGDPDQVASFMKHLAMAGGLLVMRAHGAGEWLLDACTARLDEPGGELLSA